MKRHFPVFSYRPVSCSVPANFPVCLPQSQKTAVHSDTHTHAHTKLTAIPRRIIRNEVVVLWGSLDNVISYYINCSLHEMIHNKNITTPTELQNKALKVIHSAIQFIRVSYSKGINKLSCRCHNIINKLRAHDTRGSVAGKLRSCLFLNGKEFRNIGSEIGFTKQLRRSFINIGCEANY
jgi:hypothetical protein